MASRHVSNAPNKLSKQKEVPGERRAKPHLRDLGVLLGLWAIAIVLIAVSREPAASMHHRIKETADIYVLPPPEEVVAMSLGHRSAMADFLWAEVLVEQGLHSFDKRRFESLPYLIDTINALDPTFREPYLLIEALTIFQPNNQIQQDDIRKARQILERGVKNIPNDPDILIAAGSFIGLMAPSSYLKDPAEKEQWMVDGSEYLARAAEIGDDSKFIGWQALSGVNLLRKTGKQREAVQFLERALITTEDEELREQIRSMLDRMAELDGAYEQSEARKAELAGRRRQAVIVDVRLKRYRILGRTGARVVGPPYDAAYCAGGTHSSDPRCSFDWATWASRFEAAFPQ